MEQMQEKEEKKKPMFRFTRDNFLIVILAGVLLLVIAWPVSGKDQEEKAGSESGQRDSESGMINLQTDFTAKAALKGQAESGELYTYAAYLEESLEALLSSMEGVGKVQVMITLEGSAEAVVEKDKSSVRNGVTEVDSAGGSRNTTEISEEEETVYGENSAPYIARILAPAVRGVVVSAQGGDHAQTVQNITEAIQALFGIEAHKIKIVKMYS